VRSHDVRLVRLDGEQVDHGDPVHIDQPPHAREADVSLAVLDVREEGRRYPRLLGDLGKRETSGQPQLPQPRAEQAALLIFGRHEASRLSATSWRPRAQTAIAPRRAI
jgi:hypothetical protein